MLGSNREKLYDNVPAAKYSNAIYQYDGVRTFSISLLSSMRNYDTSLVNLGNSDDTIIQTRWINQALDKGYVLKRLSMGTIGYECDYDSPNESNTTLYPEDEAVQFEQPHWQFYEKSRVSKLVAFCGLEGGSTWYQPDDKKALQKYLQLLCKRWKSNYITI
ncbi:hypothetical protein HDV02_003642 [Globomyces sp. JEL0801]|nr:hypothetical protein HDV02_003642 [Globomyces sp. JEL0801]